MAIRTTKSVIYHIPKCGGIWVKEAVRKSLHRTGMAYWRCRQAHVAQEFGLVREHSTPDRVIPEDREGYFSMAFVRNPVTWYRSYWCYRVKTGYLDKKFPLDNLWDDNYEKFLVKALDNLPGFVTQLYQFYVGKDGKRLDYVGKQENLTWDLIEALTLAGEDFDEIVVMKTQWRNIAYQSSRIGKLAVCSKELDDKIEESERWVLETFYV
jgi:hypothetical protein